MCQACHEPHRQTYKDGGSSLLDNIVTTGGGVFPQTRASSCFEGNSAYKDFAEKPEKRPPLRDRLGKISKKDKPWDRYRDVADILGPAMMRHDEKMQKRAYRMGECGENIAFAVINENGEKKWKLHNAHFCRVRGCPICAWRRSLLWIGRMLNAWPKIVGTVPDCQALMLTLTLKNCSVADFRKIFQNMGRAWHAMIKRKAFTNAIRGWLRNTEVTQGRDGTSCHPHFHILLLIDKTYFRGGKYLSQAEWQRMWKECLKIDYMPQVDIRKLKACESDPVADNGVRIPKKALLEVTKYVTKVTDIEKDPGWYVQLLEQCQGLRFVGSGGVLKNILSTPRREYTEEPEEEELLHLDGEASGEAEEIHEFSYWHEPVVEKKRRRGFYYRIAIHKPDDIRMPDGTYYDPETGECRDGPSDGMELKHHKTKHS